jgi:hypothetical protein
MSIEESTVVAAQSDPPRRRRRDEAGRRVCADAALCEGSQHLGYRRRWQVSGGGNIGGGNVTGGGNDAARARAARVKWVKSSEPAMKPDKGVPPRPRGKRKGRVDCHGPAARAMTHQPVITTDVMIRRGFPYICRANPPDLPSRHPA